MKKLMILSGLLMSTWGAFAQSHYKGIQGISAEYALDTKFQEQFTLGYHYFLGRNVNIEVNGQYEYGTYKNGFGLDYYDVKAAYTLENAWLNGTLNFTLFNLGQRIFLDFGIGPTIGSRFIKNVDAYTYAVNTSRLDEYKITNKEKQLRKEPALNEGALNDKWLIGLNTPITLEIYLSRYFSILGRYRAKYLFRPSTDELILDATVGASFHF